MPYIFRGRLCGYECANVEIPLSNVRVRLYEPPGERLVRRVAASPKETFAILDDDAVAAKESRLLAETTTNEEGEFEVELDEDEHGYDGEVLEVDGVVSEVSGLAARLDESVQFSITTFQPEWRQREEGLSFTWEYCLSRRYWCAVLERLDVWVICGRVTVCEDGDDTDEPVASVVVSAYDADFVEDDPLGNATTDANGRYRIYYRTADFRRTPFSPFINVEFQPGPDVYCRVETTGGDVLLDENRSRGRQPDRENVETCQRIDLCVPGIPGGDGEVVPSAWTGIGTAFTIPDNATLNDFDADGYAGSGRYALTGTIRATGSVPLRSATGNEVEYRFLVADSIDANTTGPKTPASHFTSPPRPVGANDNSEGLFVPTKVGQMWRYDTVSNEFTIVDVTAEVEDLDDEGWLNVNRSVERTFQDDSGLTPADIPGFQWVDLDGMMSINTAVLTDEPDVPDGAADAGEQVPAGDRIDVETAAIRFEVRELVDPATNTYQDLPGNGTTLNRAVINNNATFADLAMAQHGTDPCAPLSGSDVDVSYTVYHPHLRSVQLFVKKNDEPAASVGSTVNDPTNAVPVTGNTDPSVDHLHNPALDIVPQLSGTCTYIVTLRVQRRLHTGDGGVGSSDWQTSFYYEG